MSLLTEIESSTRKPGTVCAVATILTTLEPADAADLRVALSSATIPASAIGRALRARNFAFRDDVLTRHKRKECQCQPATS